MLVPHSGKKILTFHIPNYSIILSLLVILFLVIFSIISLNDHETNATKIASLSSRSRNFKQDLKLFKLYSKTTGRILNPLFRESRRLAANIGGVESVFADTSLRQHSFSNTNYPGSSRTEVDIFSGIGHKLSRTLSHVSNTRVFLHNLRLVSRSVPSIWPVSGEGYITSPFGRRRSPFTGMWQHHTGVDIAYWPGSLILASADGFVEAAGYMGGYGLCVMLRHKYGFRTRYAHLSSIRVSLEQNINQGSVVGTMGSTGLSTGYHLHYEVIFGLKHLNPAPFLVNRAAL